MTRDDTNPLKEMKFGLQISTDYNGTTPGLWDGSGTWQTVAGGFSLLKDRIGIRINCENPNTWRIGEGGNGMPYPLGIVHGVEDMCKPGKTFTLRLTCVIEGDKRLIGSADKRDGNPLPYEVRRVIDAKDRYRKDTVHRSSEFAGNATKATRDDTDAAVAEAMSVRFATENGVFKGNVVVPRFTRYYQLGDRIDQIEGRGIALRTNTGNSTDAAILPVVVGISHQLEGDQLTTLTLDDSGTDRSSYKQAIGRKAVKAHAR